jgi:hypothetical protein
MSASDESDFEHRLFAWDEAVIAKSSLSLSNSANDRWSRSSFDYHERQMAEKDIELGLDARSRISAGCVCDR